MENALICLLLVVAAVAVTLMLSDDTDERF